MVPAARETPSDIICHRCLASIPFQLQLLVWCFLFDVFSDSTACRVLGITNPNPNPSPNNKTFKSELDSFDSCILGLVTQFSLTAYSLWFILLLFNLSMALRDPFTPHTISLTAHHGLVWTLSIAATLLLALDDAAGESELGPVNSSLSKPPHSWPEFIAALNYRLSSRFKYVSIL